MINGKVSVVTPPILFVPANLDAEATSAGGAKVNFSASAFDGDGSPLAVTCSPVPWSTFPLGGTLVTCSAADKAGNSTSASFTVTVVDTTPPALALPGMLPVECTSPHGTVVTYPVTALDIIDGNVAVTCDPPSASAFALGLTTVRCTATDAHGNSAGGSFGVMVVDTKPPVIRSPGDQKVGMDPGECSAVVNYTITATDACSGEVVVVCNPPSCSAFEKGPTTVNCTATDASGNTATCSFGVTVTDNDNPTITAPADVLVVSDPGSCTAAEVALGTPNTADNCDVATVANDAPDEFPLGETEVTWTVMDASGNTASAVQKVTVLKSVAPTFLPPLARQPVGNKIRHGHVVRRKVTLVDCSGAAVTAGVTVKLKVQGIDSRTGRVFQEVLEDAKGVGKDGTVTSDGIMVFTHGKYQFNLDTSNFKDRNTLANATRYYRLTVTVIDNATLLELGHVAVNLETWK